MMTFLIYLLTALQLLSAFLLIGIILIQQSKAGGGLGAVGGGTTETVFGATAGNVLTKGTVVLASIFLGAALLVQVLSSKANPTASRTAGYTEDAEEPKVEEAQPAEPKVEGEEPAEAEADKPAEAKPADTKSADTKPAEAKPAEPKGEDTTPAE